MLEMQIPFYIEINHIIIELLDLQMVKNEKYGTHYLLQIHFLKFD